MFGGLIMCCGYRVAVETKGMSGCVGVTLLVLSREAAVNQTPAQSTASVYVHLPMWDVVH